MALPHGVVECFSTMDDILEPPLVVVDNHLPQEIVPAESEHEEEEESRLSEDDDDDERNPYLVDNPYLVAEDDDEEDQPDLCSTRGSNDDSSLLPPPLPNRCGLILQHHQQQLQQGEQLLHQEEQLQAKDEVKDDEFRSSRGATTVNTESLSESERRSFSYDERVVVNEPPKEIRTTPSMSSQRQHQDTPNSATTNRTKSPSTTPETKHEDEPVAEQHQRTSTPREEAKLQESNEQQHCTTPGVISVPGFVVSTAPEDIYDSSSPSNNSPNNALLNASSEESPEDVCPDSQRLVVATEVEVGIPHVDSSDLEDDHRIVFSASKAEIIYDPEEEITRRRMADELKVINNKPKNIQEKIFGNNPKRYFSNSGNIDIAASPECIRRRDVLKWTVKRNPAVSNQWVTSVQTNQKAVSANDIVEMDRCIKNFCADSKHHATELGLAMATPLQLPFGENPICYICKNKFALLRRPCHCRNCGVCICSTCSVTWPSKMIPESYNTKSESQVNACLGCDWLATMFREALIEGRFKDAVDLYTTGNVNLRTPFCNINKKEEILYPIHAAVMGGNLPLVRWLTTNHCCPLRDTNVSNIANTTSIINTTSSTISSMTTRKSNRINRTAGPILTSKGRSALGIALDNQNMEIICFLVGERGMSFGEEKDLAYAATLVNFCMRLVRMLPPGFCENHQSATTGIENNNNKKEDETTLMDRSMDRSLRSTSNGNSNNESFPLPLL